MSKQKDATKFTQKANAAAIKELPFGNTEDFELARRGFIATMPEMIIRNRNGDRVWDMEQYAFLDGEAPPTVNASLWRQAQLNALHGLFKVTDQIYQVRGFDLANMTFIEGNTGWIVIDPFFSAEPAKAAMDLVTQHLGERAIVAVIYTHSHIDHWGGVRGVIDEADVKAGKTKIIAPDDFMHYAISENVLAGNAMSRRATYMAGNFLPRDEKGQITMGLGQTTSTGEITLIPPTDLIDKTGTEMIIDGVELVFQFVRNAEAPVEITFYLPRSRALCMAEIANANLHNVLTLRGANTRDTLAWAKHLHEIIELFSKKTDVLFGSHHWPRWGGDPVANYLKKQRDAYKYIHDETLRLANHGYTMIEIAERVELPKTLAAEFYNRGYYGTVNHNAKAVYQYYLGWFDGNPANLHPLLPVEAGQRYVEFMGGAEALLSKARESYEQGEYRWVAQVLNHLVFADPDNQSARQLQADALEQLGYQAESGIWRNFYLAGAKELREGVLASAVMKSASPDVIQAMTVDMLLDFLSVCLNGPKASDKRLSFNFNFSDIDKNYAVTTENGVLNYSVGKRYQNADATVTLSRRSLVEITLGKATFDDSIISGEIQVEGRAEALNEFVSLLDRFEFWFNIVTP